MPIARARLLRVVRKALAFDGVDDYAEVSNTVIAPNTTEFSVEVLFMPIFIDGNVRVIIKQGLYTGYGFWTLYTQYTNQVRFYMRGVEGTYSPIIRFAGITANTWYHIVGVKTIDKIKLYVNTELKDIADFNKSIGINEATRIAYDSTWYYPSNCIIAFVRIYSRALSDSEVEWNYYHPDNPVRNGLVLWLHWDSIDMDNRVWRDKSGYDNDGTIYGATEVDWILSPVRTLSPVREQSPAR